MIVAKKKSLLTRSSLVVTVLMVVVCLMMTWLYTTESGLQWLVARTTPFQPQALQLGKIKGTLSTRVMLSELDWQQTDIKVSAKELVLDCQWLHLIDGLVACDTIALKALIVTNTGEENSKSTDETWPELTDIKFPIAVKIKQTTMASMVYQQSKLTASTAYNITDISINKLALARSKASVSALNLSFEKHNIAASGYLDMRDQWKHKLDLKVLGPQLSASAKSTGSIAKLSQLTLQLQAPNKITVSTDWYVNHGLFLKRGQLIAQEQGVNLANQTFDLGYINGTFALNWPKLTTKFQAQAAWQELDNIQVNIDSELTNVLAWQSNTKLTLQVQSELDEQHLAVSLSPILLAATDDKWPVRPQVWPVLVNLDVAIAKGMATIKSNDIKLGEIAASLQGEFNVNNPLAENFSLKGQLKGHSFGLKNRLKVANINANWQVKHQQSEWFISSQGNIDELALSQFNGENIHWVVDFSKRLQADIKADALTINAVDIALATLKISGLPEAHRVVLGAKVVDELSVDLSFGGQLFAENTLTDKAQSLTIKHDLSTAMWQINDLEFTALNQGQNLLLNAKQLQLSRARQSIDKLCLKGSGTLCVNADHDSEQWATSFTFDHWSISPMVEHLRTWQSILPVQYPQHIKGSVTGNLQLRGKDKTLQKVTANLSIPSFEWQEFDWQVRGKELAINSQPQQDALVITSQWQEISTGLTLPEWQSDITLPKGTLLLSLTPDFEGNFDLEQRDITLSIPNENNLADSALTQRLLTIPLIKLNGKWQQDKIATALTIQLPAEDEITAQFSSDWPFTDTAKVSGALSLNLQQFDWLKQWQKRIDKIDVSLVQDFTLAGSWQKPLFNGQGSLGIKHLVVDEYGLDIRNSQVKLNSQQDSIMLLGELQNPQGSLTLAGQAKISSPVSANLTLEGQHVTLVNNSENKLIVSPKLQANYQNKHLKVDGNLVIDQADVKIASLPKPAISVSEDQVIVDQKETGDKDSAFDYNVSLTLSAGDNVNISGFGLASEIRGDLSSSLVSGQTLVLNGRLDLKNGKFEAYKQVLTIEQGQLLFLGAAENPSIQFRAVRMVDDIKVGIIADGTIHNPRLTLFSEPAMADENVLSLLITGRNLDSLSKKEGNALTSAAISLGVESANKVVQKIGDKLGLKDIALSSKNGSDGNGTRVDIAAKINDRLHVGYGTSIDSENSIQAGWNIEYKLSPNISFEATSGEEISANINYKKQYSPSKDKAKQQGKTKDEINEKAKQ